MKRLGLVFLSLALLFAFVAVADAQSVKTGGKNDSAKSITISGEIDFPMVHRSESVNSVLDRSHAWDKSVNADGSLNDQLPLTGGVQGLIYQKDGASRNVGLDGGVTGVDPIFGARSLPEPSGPINSPASTFVNPLIRINFDIELAEKVCALISLETRRLESDPYAGGQIASTPSPAFLGTTQEFLSNPWGTRQNWGTNANKGLTGDENMSLTIGQAYVKVSEFLLQQLSLKIGIQDLKYDLRGNGNAWFLDVRHSEYAFLSPTTENFGPEGSVYGYRAFNPNAHSAGIFRDEISSPGGAKVTFNDGDTLFVDLFAMKTLSSRNFFGGFTDAGVLNQNDQNSRRGKENEAHFDEDIYGLNVDYNIPDSKSILNFITTAFSGDSGSSMIWTVGGGADYYIDALELFGEIYGQWGTYGSIRGANSVAAPGTPDFIGDNVARTRENNDPRLASNTHSSERQSIDHESFMLHAGAKYTFDMSIKPWIEVSGAYVDGDDGDVDDDNPKNRDFVSYENNNETLILEDSTWGLDVDSNYWKIGFALGMSASLDHQDDFKMSVSYCYAEVANTPDRVGRTQIQNRARGAYVVSPFAQPDQDSRASLDNIDDQLGHEVDFRVSWHYSESLSFNMSHGWLIDPEFFNSRDTYRGDGDMYIFMLDTNLKF